MQIKPAVTRPFPDARISPSPIQASKSGQFSLPLREYHHMAIKFGRPIELRDTPRHQSALTSAPLDLIIRPRRNRKAEWARRMVRENVLTTDDLIWPLFVAAGTRKRTPIAAMPGAERR